MTNHLLGVAEIAEMLGVTRQRVSQLIESYADFPKPEVELTAGRVWSRSAIETWLAMHPERKRGEAEQSGGLFSRFTARARQAVVLAQQEGIEYGYIGTEHLLLGLLAEPEGLAGTVLRDAGIDLERARASVRKLIGEPKTKVERPPFTPRAKKVLEMAMAEALKFGHNYISTEHVLLALIEEGQGVAVYMMRDVGSGPDDVRQRVLRAMFGAGPDPMRDVLQRLERIEKRLSEP